MFKRVLPIAVTAVVCLLAGCSDNMPTAITTVPSATTTTTSVSETATTTVTKTTASTTTYVCSLPTVTTTATVETTDTTVVPTPTPAFKGTVVEFYDDEVLIRVDEVKEGPFLDGTVWASMEPHWSPHRGEEIRWEIGMTIDVLYTGEIIKSDPPRLKAVLRYCNCPQ